MRTPFSRRHVGESGLEARARMAVEVEAGLAVRLSVLGETKMSTVAERKVSAQNSQSYVSLG